jgi:hypothetical protein
MFDPPSSNRPLPDSRGQPGDEQRKRAADSAARPGRPAGEADLYTHLFQQTGRDAPAAQRTVAPSVMSALAPAGSRPAAPAPPAPASRSESGLSLLQLCDLVLKYLYLQGAAIGGDIARAVRLPFNVVDEGLAFLKDERCVEVTAAEMLGRVSYRYTLTELGRSRAREAFDQCRYVGPAPVPLEDYIKQCSLQTVTGTPCTESALLEGFKELIIRPGLLAELGPAVCSGRSIFIYGPPGNGKSMIAKGLGRFLNNKGGEIYVPYAIHTEGSIITIYDPTIHRATDGEDAAVEGGAPAAQRSRILRETATDLRWRRIRRPVVITGGELTLEMLDLRFNSKGNFYQAPLHIKANGGVFLIDDFGRQIVSPRDLLNRWILPLEERIDYMTLATGKKFSVPFEQLIIFSTNLDPRELVDEAFLRRIRHKIHIGTPGRDLFTEIFEFACAQRNIPYSPEAVDFLYSSYYEQGKPPRSSDPRDLLEILQSICRFRRQEVALTEALLGEACQRFFCKL